jgi:SAM-dependent methyltransferase
VIPQAIYIDYIYETISSLGLVDHFSKYADDVIADIAPQKESLVIDIGSNDGTLLKFFKNHGMQILGIDPAVEIAKNATKSGIKTLAEFYSLDLAEQIVKDYGKATIITANNLYANVPDLDALTEAIKYALTPDGVFIFESFYLLDWYQNMVFDFTYHEHLSYFSVKPLQIFFKKHGMELIDVKRVHTKGGSVRYTVQIDGGKRPINSSVSDLIKIETDAKIHDPETLKEFSRKILAKKQELNTLLGELKGQGKKVIGYGASATSTTLIYHFGLGDSMDCIVDDYEAKQNLFSPGYHIPVLPPEAIYELNPDFILILAWRYYEPIIQKHKKFLEAGGHFIVPLPDLKIF